MENAVDALKMGFAMLLFVASLSLAIFSFTRVRETTDAITSNADIKEYYQQLALDATGVESNIALSSRMVGVETIIPTLYRYYKENYTILFYVGYNYNKKNGAFEGGIQPMTIYYTETNDSYLDNSTLINTGDSSKAIYGLDIQDEQLRREPWCRTQETSYNFIKDFVNGLNGDRGTRYYSSRIANVNFRTQKNYYDVDSTYGPYYQINFKFGGMPGDSTGLIGLSSDYQFIERYGEYNYENISTVDQDENLVEYYNIISNVTSSVDILDNGEVVENNKGTTKRVIQYIYIKSYT